MHTTLLLTGTVGVGKTSTAHAISALLTLPHAVIDMDALREFTPAPPADPFNESLGLLNLASVAANYRAAGARLLIIATAVESCDMVRKTAEASGCNGVEEMAVVRLVAGQSVLEERLRRRHDEGKELQWHLRRAPQLDEILNRARLPGIVVDAGAPLELIAQRVMSALEL